MSSVALTWPGKEQARALADASPVGALVPEAPAGHHRIIAGDNLPILGHLKRELAGQVRLIVIDPPYNTGRRFLFRDSFARGHDRHAGWLSMMLPRLRLARDLLHPEGSIFVSIDDHEVHHLRALMDEVFGRGQFVASVIWQKVFAPKNSARGFSTDHEYVLVYARDARLFRPRLLPRAAASDLRYKNLDDDPRGPWASDNLCARNPYADGVYPVTTPKGRVIPGPPPGTYWRVSKSKLEALDRDGRIWWGKGGDNQPRLKRFLHEVKDGRVPQTLWSHQEVGHTQEGKKELLARVRVASADGIFDTPKPTRLIRRMLRIATEAHRGDWVLDFFAGTGTTGEAVMQENAADAGNRRFILVELEAPTGIAEYATMVDITRARIAHAHAALTTAGRDVGAVALQRWVSPETQIAEAPGRHGHP